MTKAELIKHYAPYGIKVNAEDCLHDSYATYGFNSADGRLYLQYKKDTPPIEVNIEYCTPILRHPSTLTEAEVMSLLSKAVPNHFINSAVISENQIQLIPDKGLTDRFIKFKNPITDQRILFELWKLHIDTFGAIEAGNAIDQREIES